MKTIGFPVSKKENEKRRALVPQDFKYIKNIDCLYFESGYGDVFGCSDGEIESYGVKVVKRDQIFKCDIICDAKIGDADYLECLKNQVVFGWLHAIQNRNITDRLIERRLTAYAWEDMFEDGRHVFWRNNEIAGEAAILHAFQCYGLMPNNVKVALLGRGNVAIGALKILNQLGADVTIYTKNFEKLFQNELGKFDVIVNAILWDTKRIDHIIYCKDLKRMKRNSMIIDISCDRNGGIESSIPTTIEKPMYIVDGILHYVVDHTPSLFYKTASIGISEQVRKYIDFLCAEVENSVLESAKCIENGIILDNRIVQFQKR